MEEKQTGNLTISAYLKQEECSPVKHEYVRGQIFSMSGATDAHNVIAGNVFALLHTFLRGSDCRVYMNDMKVRIEVMDAFYYPDVMVSCEPFDAKSVFKKAPTLVVEVLSPSTEPIDRREKMVAYSQLESLKQYVLIHQSRPIVELYDKSSSGWLVRLLHFDELLTLKFIQGALEIPVREIYAGFGFAKGVREEAALYRFDSADEFNDFSLN